MEPLTSCGTRLFAIALDLYRDIPIFSHLLVFEEVKVRRWLLLIQTSS